MSKSIRELKEDRRFVQGRIKYAERQMDLIGHSNAHNEEYQARERDIAGFQKSINKLNAEIRKLKARAAGEP